MSLDLAFVLILVLRMAVTAAFVITASIVTERAGPVIGALVATLPVSTGPVYIFLALDHDATFIAQGALTSLPINAATIVLGLVYTLLAQRHGVILSFIAAIFAWLMLAVVVQMVGWSLAGGIAVNVVACAICLPLAQRFRAVKMPPIRRRWYDIPLRALLVALLVATVVMLSSRVGPAVTGIMAVFPVVFSSLMLILHPRIGGRATAAVIANALWGLVGFGIAIAVLYLAALHLGSVAALCLGLATCVGWNLGLWGYSRRRLAR